MSRIKIKRRDNSEYEDSIRREVFIAGYEKGKAEVPDMLQKAYSIIEKQKADMVALTNQIEEQRGTLGRAQTIIINHQKEITELLKDKEQLTYAMRELNAKLSDATYSAEYYRSAFIQVQNNTPTKIITRAQPRKRKVRKNEA